jgi:hypothetical protein
VSARFWLCDVAGEPGAETIPPPTLRSTARDNDLEHVLDAGALGDGLDATFRIVDASLDRWTLDMLSEAISDPEWRRFNDYTRGSIVQRVFAHDVSTRRSSRSGRRSSRWDRASRRCGGRDRSPECGRYPCAAASDGSLA